MNLTQSCQNRSMDSLTDFIAGLPKAELHVHHVGSASPQTVAALAARHAGSTPVPPDAALLAEYFTFTDFAHFIEVYLSVVDLIRDAEDVWTLTYDIARDLAAQQVRYAELTLTPYSSVIRGIAAEAFCDAVEDARRASARRLRDPAAPGASTSPARPASRRRTSPSTWP